MNIINNALDKIVLLTFLILYLILSTNLLLAEPMVWPDEAYLADIANNILLENRLGTDLWGETIIGIKDRIFWYPPIFIYTLAGWFKLFGLSIVNQRMLSVILGLILLIILYLFIQISFEKISSKRKKFTGLILILLLIFDNTFLKSSRMGRPEILVALLGLLSLYVYQLAKVKNKRFLYAASGVISGLTFLTHYIGGFFFLIILAQIMFDKKIKILKDTIFYLFTAGFILPILFWFTQIIQNFPILLKQLYLQSSFRNLVGSYIEAVFRSSSIEQKIIYLLYFLLSTIIILTFIKRRTFTNLFLYLGLLIGWLICIYAKLEWYPLYIVSFLYILAVANIFSRPSKVLVVSTSVLLLSLLLVNIRIYLHSFQFHQDKDNAYYIFGTDVKNKIEEGKTVYLSTTPDLYFLLKGRNNLYEFPTVQPNQKEYINLLNDSEYIVINFHLEYLFVGTLLDRYIEVNKHREYSVFTSNLYQAQIIELVPKDKRQIPKL